MSSISPTSCGFLNVNKPAGITSRQVVDRVQRLVRPLKTGHAGTLDPLATGVLVVAVGSATRLVQFLHQVPKTYVGRFLLGRRSATDDVDGEVLELERPPIPTSEQLLQAAIRLVGTIAQRPPAFSALKVQGQRAYDLARRGEHVELAPRQVTIHRLRIMAYEYPELTCEVECSAGTYIRAVGRDLAESLQTAAVMSHLVRTSIGPFRLDDAVELDALTADNWRTHQLPAAWAVQHLRQISVNDTERTALQRGQFLRRDEGEAFPDEAAAIDAQGGLVGIIGRRGPGLWGALINLPTT